MLRPGVFLLLFFSAGLACAQPAGEAARGWEQLSPAQRADVWSRMDPEQRDRAWRRLPPQERAAMRERMSPAEREQMRNRFLERRAAGMPPDRPGALPPGPGPGPGAFFGGRNDPRMAAPFAPQGGPEPRRLSPDERRQLREQIREANRDLPQHPRREGRGR